MALNTPSNVTITPGNTNLSVSYRTTLSTAANLRLRFTPIVYTDFQIIVNTGQSVAAGTNRNNTFTTTWENALLSSLMRGISYNIGVSVYTANDTSPYRTPSTIVKKPFLIVNSARASNAGFSATDAITIPTNRLNEMIFSTDEINYEGTWHTFPKITLTGRFNFCKLVNPVTGAYIEINDTVPSGEKRILETNPLNVNYGFYKLDSDGKAENLIHKLTEDSNLTNFIFPAANELIRPLAVEAYFFHRDNSTRVDVSFPVRYYGI